MKDENLITHIIVVVALSTLNVCNALLSETEAEGITWTYVQHDGLGGDVQLGQDVVGHSRVFSNGGLQGIQECLCPKDEENFNTPRWCYLGESSQPITELENTTLTIPTNAQSISCTLYIVVGKKYMYCNRFNNTGVCGQLVFDTSEDLADESTQTPLMSNMSSLSTPNSQMSQGDETGDICVEVKLVCSGHGCFMWCVKRGNISELTHTGYHSSPGGGDSAEKQDSNSDSSLSDAAIGLIIACIILGAVIISIVGCFVQMRQNKNHCHQFGKRFRHRLHLPRIHLPHIHLPNFLHHKNNHTSSEGLSKAERKPKGKTLVRSQSAIEVRSSERVKEETTNHMRSQAAQKSSSVKHSSSQSQNQPNYEHEEKRHKASGHHRHSSHDLESHGHNAQHQNQMANVYYHSDPSLPLVPHHRIPTFGDYLNFCFFYQNVYPSYMYNQANSFNHPPDQGHNHAMFQQHVHPHYIKNTHSSHHLGDDHIHRHHSSHPELANHHSLTNNNYNYSNNSLYNNNNNNNNYSEYEPNYNPSYNDRSTNNFNHSSSNSNDHTFQNSTSDQENAHVKQRRRSEDDKLHQESKHYYSSVPNLRSQKPNLSLHPLHDHFLNNNKNHTNSTTNEDGPPTNPSASSGRVNHFTDVHTHHHPHHHHNHYSSSGHRLYYPSDHLHDHHQHLLELEADRSRGRHRTSSVSSDGSDHQLSRADSNESLTDGPIFFTASSSHRQPVFTLDPIDGVEEEEEEAEA